MRTAEFVFQNGDRVKDRITTLSGVVVSRAEHLFGCNRYWVQPQGLKDGKQIEGMWIDEDSLELVKAGAIQAQRYRVVDEPVLARKAGGPFDVPASHARAELGR